jgi:phosphate transport system substrate-binding protein
MQGCRNRFIALLLCLCLLTAPARADEAVPMLLRLHGSNTIGQRLAPTLARAWAEREGWNFVSQRTERIDEYVIELRRDRDVARIEVAAHGTGTGLDALLDRRADVWMASRPVTDAELAKSSTLGRLDLPAQEHVIALDGIAIVVHPNNPLQALSVPDLRRIFGGQVRDWSALGRAPGSIALHARDDRSGTYDTFKSLVLDGAPLAASARRYESSDELVAAVMKDRDAIGFVGLDAVGSTRALAIADAVTRALPPKRMDIATEDYALSRRLYLYAPELQSEHVRDFIEFAEGPSGQALAERIGFVGQQLRAESVPLPPGMPDEYRLLTDGARRVSVNFRFDSGLTYLDGKALRDLKRLTDFLGDGSTRGHEVTLIGFSDAREASPIDAIMLSNERADYIAQEMLRVGLPVRRVRGMADASPVASNETEAGRRRNRRVEVWIKPRAPTAAR